MDNNQNPTPQNSFRKHKGGRPTKPDEEKHVVCKKVYYTEEDSKCIEAAADEYRMSDSEYIAKMSLDGKVVAPIDPEFAKDFRAVASMANNLNQLAHRANADGFSAVAREMLVELPKIRAVLNVIYSCL